ncbi:DUF1707 domain-containing protein [soil metagenome]
MCGHHHHRTRQPETGAVLAAPADPNRRISTAERERAVDQLRLHTDEGRIDLDEFGDRVATVLAADTACELIPVFDGLPHVTLPAERRRRAQQAQLAVFGPYLAVMALLVAIWLVSGAGYFWPIWPMLGWGIPVALGALGAARSPSPTSA